LIFLAIKKKDYFPRKKMKKLGSESDHFFFHHWQILWIFQIILFFQEHTVVEAIIINIALGGKHLTDPL